MRVSTGAFEGSADLTPEGPRGGVTEGALGGRRAICLLSLHCILRGSGAAPTDGSISGGAATDRAWRCAPGLRTYLSGRRTRAVPRLGGWLIEGALPLGYRVTEGALGGVSGDRGSLRGA